MGRLFVIGAAVLDVAFDVNEWPAQNRSIYAQATRISAGGKGLNQAIAARRLGATVNLIACVGRDDPATLLLNTLKAEAVSTDFVIRHPTAQTSVVGMIVYNSLPGYIGAPAASKQITSEQVTIALRSLTPQDVLLVNFEAPQEVVRSALALAHSAGARSILNPAPYFTTDRHIVDYLAEADYCIPNLYEAQHLIAKAHNKPSTVAKALRTQGARAVCITLGEKGCYYTDGQQQITQAAFKVEVVDTTGASDAFCAAFAVGLLETQPIEDTLRFATATAGLACTVKGTVAAMPYRQNVDVFLKQA